MTTIRRRDESGQGSLEALGVMVLAALLVGAIVAATTASSPTMTSSITSSICKIVTLGQGDCSTTTTEARSPDQYVPPQQCTVDSTDNTTAVGVAVTFVKVEGGDTWKIENLGDGTSRLTRVTNTEVGGTVGVGFDFSATIDGSKLGLQASADAEAMLGQLEGDIYYADSNEVAQAIMGDKKSDETKDFWWGDSGPIRWLADEIGGVGEHEGREPDEWFVEDSMSIGGSAGATLLWGSAEAEATVAAYLGTKNKKDGSTTEYYRGTLEGSLSGDIMVANAGLTGSMEALIEIDRDAEGNPVAMRLTSELMGLAYADGDTSDDSEQRPQIQRQVFQIPLTSESDRDLASRVLWASGIPFMPGLNEGITDIDAIGAPWEIGQIARDLAEAVDDRGYAWQETHTVNSNENGFDVAGKLGMELGVDATWSETTTTLDDYTYWDGSTWTSRPGC